ncbi:DEAD/DEAH box helicase [Streptomyces sp. NPDC004539]|uniref:DEAD/DEAH box helicase n=1 Tax=Streptomyces sp. NPDC004539 TaxID=3154280 RepID=UPI0033A5BE55
MSGTDGMTQSSETGTDTSVPDVMWQRWGVVLDGPFPARFSEPGWSYAQELTHCCPACQGELHALRKPYESQGRTYKYVALVCAACPAAFALADLGVKRYDQLDGAASAPTPVTRIHVPRQPQPPAKDVRGPVWPQDLPAPEQTEPSALFWHKVTDPAWRPAEAALTAADDARVIVPYGEEHRALRTWLTERKVPHRVSRYWGETEQVGTVNDLGGRTDLVAVGPNGAVPVAGPWAAAARDAFAAQWDSLEELPEDGAVGHVPVTELVPAEWAALLPYPTFNPAQAAAVPVVREGSGHLVVVAPTGAGKTPIGMVAALDAHSRGHKAAWLVPQRSLTDELDRELEAWRRQGLRVVRLTGEAAVDAELIREAHVWVATTEKFEAICRAGSQREALGEVGCLVVDEIHLLGDPTRGAVLEALLTRVRDDSEGTRIVGLSATVANADEVAEWLGAHLVRTAWRPTRLSWQVPVLPPVDEADWAARAAVRTEAAVRTAREVTSDGGSVLVFCGSKRRVRSTALALAGDRGVSIAGADVDDPEVVERLCTKAGVRLHYRDWPYKREAEQAFRAREADVLVATSTVAAGVNLPARAVVVSDTTVGMDRIEVSMVQQMFGRAGRIGAGEREGWAFLLADPAERAHWQARLAAGYTVTSRLDECLSDHLLAEVVQGRLSTLDDAEQWWESTFAAHQGHDSVEPLHESARSLVENGCLRSEAADEARLEPTPLGQLTSRFMVDVTLAHELADALRTIQIPDAPLVAEQTLAAVLSTLLPTLEQAPFTDRAKTALRRVLKEADGTEDDDEGEPVAGDLARAVLWLAAEHTRLFRGRPGYVLGIPVDSMTGILEEAQRYLAWLGAQGPLGTVHPWVAVVASDLAQRIRWRTLGPGRGSGRLLWMCERMATAPLAPRLVPRMWRAARERGIDAPDWTGTVPPADCALPLNRYRALLQERATGSELSLDGGVAHVLAPPRSAIRVWNGAATAFQVSDGRTAEILVPHSTTLSGESTGVAVFTWGDRLATGWLAVYTAIGGRRSSTEGHSKD